MLIIFQPASINYIVRIIFVAAVFFVGCSEKDHYDYIRELDQDTQSFTVSLFHEDTVNSLTITGLDNSQLFVQSKTDTSNLISIPHETMFLHTEDGIEVTTKNGIATFADAVKVVGENGRELFAYLKYAADNGREVVLRGNPVIKAGPKGMRSIVTAYENDLIAAMMVDGVQSGDPEAYKHTMAVVYRTTLYAATSSGDAMLIDVSERSGIQFGTEVPGLLHYTPIEETAEHVALYRNLPVLLYTSKMCGGMTATPDMIWQDMPPEPHHQIIICQECIAKGSYEWSNTVSVEVIGEALFNHRGYVDIWISNFYENGRPKSITAQLGERKKTFTVEEFRKRITTQTDDNQIILSDWFEIETDPDTSDRKPGPLQLLNINNSSSPENVHFIGWGRGHGVGLCKYSARQQAAAGKNFSEILQHFYPRLETGRIQREQ